MLAKIPRIPSKSPNNLNLKIKMTFWWLIEALFFKPSLHKMNGFRCMLLRAFGAKVGVNTFINSRAKIWFPWNLDIGSNGGIGFDALIYNLDKVVIGDYATVSQRVHINTGSHDYTDAAFPLVTRPVNIGRGAFIGADSYIGLGINIGEMAVIGARSVVVSDMPSYTVSLGHPCKPYKTFEVKTKVLNDD